MTDNTPLNADDELDKAAQLLGIYLEEIDVDGYMPINVNRQTLAHILADRKKHELQARLDTATDILYGFSRTYKQEVTDSSGNVYANDSHGYISKYEVQELVARLKQELEKL